MDGLCQMPTSDSVAALCNADVIDYFRKEVVDPSVSVSLHTVSLLDFLHVVYTQDSF